MLLLACMFASDIDAVSGALQAGHWIKVVGEHVKWPPAHAAAPGAPAAAADIQKAVRPGLQRLDPARCSGASVECFKLQLAKITA